MMTVHAMTESLPATKSLPPEGWESTRDSLPTPVYPQPRTDTLLSMLPSAPPPRVLARATRPTRWVLATRTRTIAVVASSVVACAGLLTVLVALPSEPPAASPQAATAAALAPASDVPPWLAAPDPSAALPAARVEAPPVIPVEQLPPAAPSAPHASVRRVPVASVASAGPSHARASTAPRASARPAAGATAAMARTKKSVDDGF